MNVKSIAGQLRERRARFALSSDSAHPRADRWSVSDFVALTKPRVMMLALFTALVGLSRAPVRLDPLTTFAAVLAIAAGAAAAGVLNMWYDADIDAIMSRTAMRPIPRGKVSRFVALILGLFLGGFAVVVLALATNLTAAALLAGTILLSTESGRSENNRGARSDTTPCTVAETRWVIASSRIESQNKKRAHFRHIRGFSQSSAVG